MAKLSLSQQQRGERPHTWKAGGAGDPLPPTTSTWCSRKRVFCKNRTVAKTKDKPGIDSEKLEENCNGRQLSTAAIDDRVWAPKGSEGLTCSEKRFGHFSGNFCNLNRNWRRFYEGVWMLLQQKFQRTHRSPNWRGLQTKRLTTSSWFVCGVARGSSTERQKISKDPKKNMEVRLEEEKETWGIPGDLATSKAEGIEVKQIQRGARNASTWQNSWTDTKLREKQNFSIKWRSRKQKKKEGLY
jgi:hypothetical protein